MNQTSEQPPEQPLLRIEDLAVSFATGANRVRAVNGVNMSIYPRQTLAVVGESGCGKSVSALSTLQLVPTPPGRFESGRIGFDGNDLLTYSEKQMREIRGNHIAMIFQEPMTSLNPVYTIGDQILEAVLLHQNVNREQAIDIAEQALTDVGIADARRRLDEYPHQMSGGMRQRVMIAMALACKPRLLLADEPTTALDVTIQAQILELLRRLQRAHDMSIMLITHDLGVVAENADVVAVMYAGRVVEYANVHTLFDNPKHPYTRGLFESMPKLGETHGRLTTVPDVVPDHSTLPDEYVFEPHPDAPYEPFENFPLLATIPEDADRPMIRFLHDTATRNPTLYEVEPQHWVSCWRTDRWEPIGPTKPDILFRRDEATASV